MKQKIRLTESQLQQVIKESVKRILNEKAMNESFQSMMYNFKNRPNVKNNDENMEYGEWSDYYKKIEFDVNNYIMRNCPNGLALNNLEDYMSKMFGLTKMFDHSPISSYYASQNRYSGSFDPTQKYPNEEQTKQGWAFFANEKNNMNNGAHSKGILANYIVSGENNSDRADDSEKIVKKVQVSYQ